VSLLVDPDARVLSPALVNQLRRQLARMVKAAGLTEGRALEATFRLTTDAIIHELNRDYRKKDKPTDVLAFAQREGPAGATDESVLGDVVVSVETARRQAKKKGPHGLFTEIRFLASHGLCHLLGYDHNNDEEEAEMNARMQKLLDEAARMGPVRPA
jgi:probable rRNA maturation factor